MSNQQTVLTALGCAGSLAAMLAVASPAIASPATAAEDADSLVSVASSLVQSNTDPLTDALGCTCAVCTGGVIQRPIF